MCRNGFKFPSTVGSDRAWTLDLVPSRIWTLWSQWFVFRSWGTLAHVQNKASTFKLLVSNDHGMICWFCLVVKFIIRFTDRFQYLLDNRLFFARGKFHYYIYWFDDETRVVHDLVWDRAHCGCVGKIHHICVIETSQLIKLMKFPRSVIRWESFNDQILYQIV